jgi:hypothetical protein
MIISTIGFTTAISSRSALVVRFTTMRTIPAGRGSRPALAGGGFMFAVDTPITERAQLRTATLSGSFLD